MADESESTTPDDMLLRAQAILAELDAHAETAKGAKIAVDDAQRAAAATIAEVQAKATEVATIATQAMAAKIQITDAQAVIASKSDHIQDAQVHADKVRAELDRVLTTTKQHLTTAEGLKNNAQSHADAASQLLTAIRTTKANADSDLTATNAARKGAEDALATAKRLADRADAVDKRIAEYEGQLKTLKERCEAQLALITDLLPGATAAGLAHAFDDRRKTFLQPAGRWQLLFVLSVLSIVGLTVLALWHSFTHGAAPTYDELFRMWLARLPVMIALVWLALHSSREAALAKRLEEDYGYKAAIAACFEGFKNQVSAVGGSVSPDSALARLLKNTLQTIAEPPGRIYDKHTLAVTPADEAKQVVKATAEAMGQVKGVG